MSDYLTDDDDDSTQLDSQVIDDTVNDSLPDPEATLLHPLIPKHRDSDIVTLKKRTPKPLSSDSEASSEDENGDESIAPSKLASRKPDESVHPKPISSDSEASSEDDNDDESIASSSKVASRKPDESVHSKPTSSDSEASSEDDDGDESIASSSKVASRKPDESVHEDSEEDILNLSAKMKGARISTQFQPGQGMLNSTTVQEKNRSENLTDDDSDIIEISDTEIDSVSPVKGALNFKDNLRDALKAHQQRTLMSFGVKREVTTPAPFHKMPPNQGFKILNQEMKNDGDHIGVSPSELEAQRSKVRQLEEDLNKISTMVRTINLEALSDKGALLKARHANIKTNLESAIAKLAKMVVTKADPPKPPKPGTANWADLKAGADNVLPRTFGKIAMSTYNEQKAMTLDRLQQLHDAIKSAPKESDFVDDPKGLKVPLMPHQKSALAWLIFREKEKPSGGILSDDMGLGKTLTMISLIVKSNYLEKTDEENDENEYEGKNVKYKGGTLVICPASLLNQWSGEIDRRLKRGLLSYDVFHGTKREANAKKLAEYDVVITTYATANVECNKNGVLTRIKWRRIILDEAHQIRNHKSQTSEACCTFSAKSRSIILLEILTRQDEFVSGNLDKWALTGTPLHNKELDMFALLKFLRCTPFDDIGVWKKWVSSAQERLHTVISSLMLRRTKAELMEKGALECMPTKEWLLINVELDHEEMGVYHKVLIFSRTLFTQYLHQRAEKNQDLTDQKLTDLPNNDPNGEYFKMRQKLLKLNKVKNVSSHEILVLLTRLRQICCHCSLITAMLDGEAQDVGSDDEECEEMNLLDQLKKLNIDDETHEDEYDASRVAEGLAASDQKVTLKEASKGLLNPSHPVFLKDRRSSKIKVVIKLLKEKVMSTDDKAILVSQWPTYLRLVGIHLKEEGIIFEQLDGSVPVPKRMEMVNRFNDPNDKVRILLLSLTAGGVGLNLVGANHLLLLDLHWNPQLESQAQDRIYRVGQEKPVFVYKFLATSTIEERIKALQDKKLAMAEGMLTGSKQVMSSKLSLDDLKMIFGVGPPATR